MKTLLMVALGGAIGASGRYGIGVLAGRLTHGDFPAGTFTANIVGSFVLGVLAGLMTFAWNPAPEIRAFLVVGVLGGFTTFSAFSLDVVLLMERGRPLLAAGYLVATVVVSVGGLFAGLRLMRSVLA